jgi:hypothetical protein
MPLPDQDSELLRKSAEAAVHAADQAWIHMEAEYAGNIPGLMQTLGESGPYAYTIMPQVLPDGGIKLPIATTAEEIEECYKFVRGRSDLLKSEALIEIRGSWYVFTEALNRGRPRGSDVIGESITYAMFPSAAGKGITGELVWMKVPRDTLGAADPARNVEDGLPLRRHMMLEHDRYLDALRRADVDGVLDVMNARVYAAVRDYVNETGTLTNLDSHDGHRAYYRALFDMYEVLSVDLMDRVVQEGYVFAEIRFTMRRRGGAGEVVGFNTAEFFVPGRDARFMVRIGHGTEPTPV